MTLQFREICAWKTCQRPSGPWIGDAPHGTAEALCTPGRFSLSTGPRASTPQAGLPRHPASQRQRAATQSPFRLQSAADEHRAPSSGVCGWLACVAAAMASTIRTETAIDEVYCCGPRRLIDMIFSLIFEDSSTSCCALATVSNSSLQPGACYCVPTVD